MTDAQHPPERSRNAAEDAAALVDSAYATDAVPPGDADHSDGTDRPPRSRTLVTLLGVSAVLLVPLFLGFWHIAEEAVRNQSISDWQGNHETKLRLQRDALVLVGVPVLCAACGWIVASLRDRPAAVPVARTLLTGAVLLWLILGASVYTTFMAAPLF
ncbi:hypothetical protein [Streptomyces sp. NPDC008125]|uniref:hypothetical protein n=1 Tax=Streptomyces sp. NPDC008125 TaxID=3364811 RepID=UPI0036ECC316